MRYFSPMFFCFAVLVFYSLDRVTAAGIILGRPSEDTGAREIDIAEFPFQVSVQKNSAHICSGIIVNTQFVVVAGHCVEIGEANHYEVKTGTTDCTKPGQLHEIQRIYVHPEYDRITQDFDVAVLKLEKPLIFNMKTAAVPLNEDAVEVGTHGVSSGWPETDSESKKVLQYADVIVVENERCWELYSQSITENMFCAQITQETTLTSQSTQGRPFIANGKLVGLASKGPESQVATDPEMYTNIATLLPFIKVIAGL